MSAWDVAVVGGGPAGLAVALTTAKRGLNTVVLEPGTLPRTSSGKLRRGEALRRFLAGELTAPKQVGTVGLVVEMAKSALAFVRAGREG